MKNQLLGIIAIMAITLGSCTQPTSTKELFNSDWQFTISDDTFDEIQSATEWEAVSLPHTAVIEPKVMTGQWQGICWYKKTFEIPASAKNQNYLLRFEGAMNASEFWINGVKVASHQGGYLPVVFDFTQAAKIGENTIFVRLDNTDNKITGPKPMATLDFNMYGGLYRDAFLIIKNKLHITDPILAAKPAGGGVFVTYPKVEKESATVKVQTNMANNGANSKSFTVVNELWDGTQLTASNTSSETKVTAGSTIDAIAEIEVKNPKLWSPKSPSLYTLKTKVLLNGKVVDEEETHIGIRKIGFQNNKFQINGEELFLRGVNRHQDYPYVGYALSNEANYRDAVKIKEAGFDYIRLSHYPHSPAFMDACDELGLVVLDAILGWQYFSRDSLFQQHIFETAHDLIRRDRNHPCVLAWEVSLNESWMDEPFIDKLHSIAHEEYPGDQCFSAGWQEYGYDIYLQARQHRLKHYREPEKPYSVSEYGDWEYYAQNAGFNQDDWGGLKQSERTSRQLLSDGEAQLLQQATNIQEAHNDNFNTPAFSDSYWVMYDYNRGYSDDLEASGIASIDRIPKFSYYFYQSQRDADEISELYESGPMVHIASYWQKNSPLNVRVFSNADEVELLLNGKRLGTQKPDDNRISNHLAHSPFTFNIPKFEAGELLAKAYIDGKIVATHSVKTPLEAKTIELKIDESGRKPKAGVNDVVFVYASLKDENGTTVPLNEVDVQFEVKGDAKLVSPGQIKTEAGVAAILIKIGANTDEISISASGENLTSGTITFIPE
ncbi:MAG: glycoside hydrolase family 2 TIM barrel-domain containing protein [Prolixibacteraceae bacterium]